MAEDGAPWRTLILATALLTVVIAAVALPATGQEPAGSAADEAQAEQQDPVTSGPTIAYDVAIEGVDDDALKTLLEDVSEAKRLVERPPPSLARLRRRAEDDVANLERALRSQGYYDPVVRLRLERDAEPVEVVFTVEPGPLYRLREIVLDVGPPETAFVPPAPAAIGLAVGEAAEAQRILDAEEALVDLAEAQGYPLAAAGQRRAVVDHDLRAMDLTLRMDTGPRGRFGETRIEGLSDVDETFVRNRLPWQEGELITPDLLSDGRQDLVETGLFTGVRVQLAAAQDDRGRFPVTVELSERKHRSIALGVRYRTDEGPGGSIGWEHRNLFGAGERLEIEADGSGIGYFLNFDFRKPDFGLRDQSLLSDARIDFRDTDAFTSESAGASIGLGRKLAEKMFVEGRLKFRAVKIDEAAGDQGDEDFGLLSLPLAFDWDRSDDLLNPSRGNRITVTEEPFVDTFGTGVVFNKTRVGFAQYYQAWADPQLVLAGRVAFGTLFGAERDDVPADERFYAGGGGSVRGFGFQLAGELDESGDPLGGRSLLELSGEVRARVTQSIGGVVFVDAGSAFEPPIPDFDPALRVGAGFGLRYFSPVGPLRADIGFPINRRDVDDAFQVYISLGQAF